eukprot:gene11007-11994_t
MEELVYTIKVCYENDIRRIQFRKTTNFFHVVELVNERFPSLKGKDYSLYWRDSEGEMIICSLEDEFQDALYTSLVNNEILRLEVRLRQEQVETLKFTHSNFSCDECGVAPIVGIRYKHTVCHTYNYCKACEKGRKFVVESINDPTMKGEGLPLTNNLKPTATAELITDSAEPIPPAHHSIEEGLRKISLIYNKVVKESYENLSSQLTAVVRDILIPLTTEEETKAALQRISDFIFDISTKDKTYTRLFANLYRDLTQENPWFKNLAELKYRDTRLTLIDIKIIDPNVDYNGYTNFVKNTHESVSLLSFLTYLGKNGVVKKSLILKIIRSLVMRICVAVFRADKALEVNEMMNYLVIIFDRDIIVRDVGDFMEEENESDEEDRRFIKDSMTELAKCKSKDCPGITNRTMFSLQDLIRKYNN